MRIAGNITACFDFLASLDEAFGLAGTLPATLGKSAVGVANGSGAFEASVVLPFTLSLTASTPLNWDLTALLWPDGTTPAVFAYLRGLLAWNAADPATHASAVTKVGPASANGWLGPFGGTTPTLEIRAGSPLLIADLSGGAHWAVSPTHRYLALDPGPDDQTINGILFGV